MRAVPCRAGVGTCRLPVSGLASAGTASRAWASRASTRWPRPARLASGSQRSARARPRGSALRPRARAAAGPWRAGRAGHSASMVRARWATWATVMKSVLPARPLYCATAAAAAIPLRLLGIVLFRIVPLRIAWPRRRRDWPWPSRVRRLGAAHHFLARHGAARHAGDFGKQLPNPRGVHRHVRVVEQPFELREFRILLAVP